MLTPALLIVLIGGVAIVAYGKLWVEVRLLKGTVKKWEARITGAEDTAGQALLTADESNALLKRLTQ